VDNRKRYFDVPSLDDIDYKKKIGSISREAGNARIQGSCASVSKRALCLFLDRCEKECLDIQLAIIVHDEIACYSREDQAERVARVLEDSMKDGWYYYFKKVPMVVEAVVSDTWKH
jgi:DNA polymerase I-like protein with 3'-5' exonuclease and polymerase domains